MADIRLNDIVLLRSAFEMWPEGAAAEAVDESQRFEYPDGDYLLLSSTSSREDDEFVLYLDAKLEAPVLPFRLELMIGARYSIVDEPELSAENAEPTLVWLIFPYLRELIGSITARSPLPPYYLPALSKLPHPSAFGRLPALGGKASDA